MSRESNNSSKSIAEFFMSKIKSSNMGDNTVRRIAKGYKRSFNGHIFDDDRFKIRVGEGKYVSGGKFSDKKPEYNVLWTLYVSFKFNHQCILFALDDFCKYAHESSSSYNPHNPLDRSDQRATYYLQNLAYRVLAQWDILAQFYCELDSCKTPLGEIHAMRFFKEPKYKEIATHLKASNHQFVRDFRNSFTHRVPDSQNYMNRENVNVRPPLGGAIDSICRDYSALLEFLKEPLDRFESIADDMRAGSMVDEASI